MSSEVVKRILRRIARNTNIKHCQAIARATEQFSTEISGRHATLIIGEEKIDMHAFKEDILHQYSNYFSVKGRI